MPIREEALASPENAHVALKGLATLRHAFSLLVSRSKVAPWWHLVVLRRDGAWAAARYDQLFLRAKEDLRRLDLPLDELDGLVPVQVVDREGMSTGEAGRLARRSRAGLLVVLEQGRFVGILCAAPHRSGLGASCKDFRNLVAEAFELPSPAHVLEPGSARLDPDETGEAETRYTDIACPRQVWWETPRFNLVVRLVLEVPGLSRAPARLEVEVGSPVFVVLQATPAFEVLGSEVQEISVLPGRDSAPAVFDLRPCASGHRSLVLDFFQRGHPLTTVVVPIEVTEFPVPESQARAPLQILPTVPEVPPPDRVLRIAWDRDRSTLVFHLLQEGARSWWTFPPVCLERDPVQWGLHLLQDLGLLAEQGDPTTSHVADVWSRLSPEGIERRLKTYGHHLWWTLMPSELRALYDRERGDWRDGSLLIYSDEPHIPWELLWPYGDSWEDSEPWCLTLRLSRWLRRDERGGGNLGAPGNIPLTTLACLAPSDTHLQATLRESSYLHNRLVPLGVRDVSPIEPTWEAVIALLEDGCYDWLHLAAHGDISSEAADRHTAIWLQGGEPLTPQHIVGPDIEGHLRRVRPAFLFNVCHGGRLDWSLTGLAGWASRLVSCGSGLFLGPLWKVQDEAAWRLAQALYDALLAGEPVAEATRQARRAAREPGDLTWLAYSLYAHPNARVHPGHPHSNTRPSSLQV